MSGKQTKDPKIQTQKSPYSLLSSYRTELMGFATLWVMYNHAMLLSLTATREPFRFVQLSAHISVDIFFLLSGFGIYHSLSKNTIRDYFLKRLARLFPVWASFLLLHLLVDTLYFHLTFSLKEIIGFLSFQGFRAGLGNQGNWYVYTLFLYYLIAPIPFSFFKESKHKLTTCILLTGITYLASYSYFGNRDLLITFIRIPAFLLGMYMACAKDERPLSKTGLLICLSIVLVFGGLHFYVLRTCSDDVLWDYGLWWHCLIPMAIPFSLLFCFLLSFFNQKKNLLLRLLRLIGSASLEIFLIHLYIFKYWGEITGILLRQSVPVRILVFFLSIPAGMLWHLLIETGRKAVRRTLSHA